MLCGYTAQLCCNFAIKIYYAMEDKKILLSNHVEDIFKRYVAPGLFICDLATGGGKSYTIGKLTCQYYPKHFERIVILCVQNKLIEGMNREIDKFIDVEDGLKHDDKLVIENNFEVIVKAVRNGSLQELVQEMKYQTGELRNKGFSVSFLDKCFPQIEAQVSTIQSFIRIYNDDSCNSYVKEEIEKAESLLRRQVRNFYVAYKTLLQSSGILKNVGVKYILAHFPSLVKVYPQVNLHAKKVLIMTVHKAMYGIDPILSEGVNIRDFTDKKTLIIFDESDQAAVAMRDVIIAQACQKLSGQNKFSRGYQNYLHYLDLVQTKDAISDKYYGGKLVDALLKGHQVVGKNWKRMWGQVNPYKNIFLRSSEPVESFRRGVFFSGPTFKLDIGSCKDKRHTFVCYKNGEKEFQLAHSDDDAQLKEMYDKVVPLDRFLRLVCGNVTSIKKHLCGLIQSSLKQKQDEFKAGVDERDQYMGWPTKESETHTLLARFETVSEKLFEGQLLDYIITRRNLEVTVEDRKYKMEDTSFYMQGCQLFQEDIDERDNAHRVRLSCREISTTPEKILYSLVISGNVTVVLCSATASSGSVISNFDIEYLRHVLGNRVHLLSEEDSKRFDELVAATYPKNHIVCPVPIEHYKYEDKRKERVSLPDKYRQMFCESALQEGLVDEWFKLTRKNVFANSLDNNDPTFYLYRIYQFIESYHWFHTHDDIHSMLYFQNRAAAKDREQMNVIASLIDGSYKDKVKEGDFEDDLPEWTNAHLAFSNSLSEVEGTVLAGLSDGTIDKVMLVTAYGSFKAGANLQFQIPKGVSFEKGDNWETDETKLKKDWDAIYLQSPTSYLALNDINDEQAYEKGIYQVMMSLMMLKERGWLSRGKVQEWLNKAIVGGKFYFNEESVASDKAAWALTVVEQAVGRICRTRNKPQTTYILFDETMEEYFSACNISKSRTKEFKALSNYILDHLDKRHEAPAYKVKLINEAEEVQRLLGRMRRMALKYTPHPYVDEDDMEEDFEVSGIPYKVKMAQIMNQRYKHAIISKPVIESLEELDEVGQMVPFLNKCYGAWPRSESGELIDTLLSSSSVRLDVLMRNDVIREYFEKHGYATEWKASGLILHPDILKADYAGEIGEEAFKALVLRYTEATKLSFAHLEDEDYELADFVINNPDGSHKVAFDVKNMNPVVEHDDRDCDLPTAQKRKMKEERLGCPLYTVNMLKMPSKSMDRHEICGFIDEHGHVLPEAIELIKTLIEK